MVFSCLIWYLIDRDKKILEYFYYVLIISFTILALGGYAQFLLLKFAPGFNLIPYSDRVSSFFGDELILGSYLSRLFPLLFALFIIKKKKEMKYIILEFCISLLIYLFFFLRKERRSFF